MPEDKITVYGAPWCPDCRRAKQFLGEQRVAYNWADIDQDEQGREYVLRWTPSVGQYWSNVK